MWKNEDDFHLFFDCQFAQTVWFASPIGLKVESLHNLGKTQLQDVIHYILSSCKNKDTLQFILCILWCIWKARNDLIFNKISTSPLQVLHKAKALQQEKESTDRVTMHSAREEENRGQKVQQTEQNWNINAKEPKIYTDAAFKCKTSSRVNLLHKERAGIGIYIEWEKEDHKAIYIQVASFAHSALQAEAQALEIAAQVGKSLNIHNPVFLTDNLILVQAIQKNDHINHPGHWIIRSNLHQFFNHVQDSQANIFKIKREINGVAHNQAQLAAKSQISEECTYRCNRHPSNQCPVIAAISNLNVHPSTFVSVNCH